MSKETLDERNQRIHERMLNFKEIKFVPFPQDSLWLKPFRMQFIQDNRKKDWDLMRAHMSVMIIVFNISRKKLVMVRQFRPAAYACFLPSVEGSIDLAKYPPSLGVTLELCAGIVDKNKPLVEIAQDELREECGYEAPISAFEKVITYRFIASTAAKQTLYYVEVTDEMNTHPGGGAEEEGELIEIIEMSVDDVKKYMSSDEVTSPPCFLFGISWFLENKKSRYT